jgi:signal transduction histidine kinase
VLQKLGKVRQSKDIALHNNKELKVGRLRDMDKTTSAKMRPRARLISLIGEELISDESVAVVELVKNAYDADASEVKVKFEADGYGEPTRLIVEDNGHGMDLDVVLGSWFEPGTVTKKHKERSPMGRLYQGAKGVGRFAAARLGTELILETKSVKSKQSVTVLLEWGKFDDDSYLDEVEITYEKEDIKPKTSGTRLTIEGLQERKTWVEDDYKSLHYRLSRLISPFNEISDFQIHLEVPHHPEITGEVEIHPIASIPRYKFSGEITENGQLNGVFEYEGKQKEVFKNHALGKEDEKVNCGPFELEIRVWDRDRDGLSPYMLKYDMNLTAVRKTIDNYSGVSIYRDGFRVHPYGETGDDWLSLDNRSRQQPTLRLAKNQIISSIKISRSENKELKDRTTREGLVHNHEFEELNLWFLRVLSVLEEERYRLRPREDAKPEYVNTLFEAFDMSEVVSEADKQLGKTHPVTSLVKRKDVEIRDGVVKLQEHYSRVMLAAGLGQLVDLVIHEIGAPLGRINRELNHINKLINKYEFDKSDGESFTKGFNNIKSWLELIANLRAKLDPKTAGKRGRATSFNVAEEILGNLILFENLINKQKIKVNFKEPKKDLVVHMSRSNLGQIVANIIDNSIYWLTRSHGDGNGGVINIELNPTKDGFNLLFNDDGLGIDEKNREIIFDQSFSTKPNGMGLGLYISRQIIEPYGRLIYRDDCDMAGACFELMFERKVGL